MPNEIATAGPAHECAAISVTCGNDSTSALTRPIDAAPDEGTLLSEDMPGHTKTSDSPLRSPSALGACLWARDGDPIRTDRIVARYASWRRDIGARAMRPWTTRRKPSAMRCASAAAPIDALESLDAFGRENGSGAAVKKADNSVRTPHEQTFAYELARATPDSEVEGVAVRL